MANVIGPAEGMAWILATLQADSTLVTDAPGGFWYGVAPQSVINAGQLYVLIAYQGGADVMGSFADRLFTNGLYQVVAVAPNASMQSLVTASRLIDADLHRKSGTAQGGVILASYREQPLVLSQVLSGTDILWTRMGGLYRLLVQ